jgi:hypothetical protein
MTVTTVHESDVLTASEPHPLMRWSPLTGFAFVVLFVVGVVASSPPADGATDAKWIAAYTGNANKAGHIVTGVCLALAGLCLLAFMTALWTRIVDARRPTRVSPLPIVAAGVAAACMAVGGVLMGGAISVMSAPTPDANLLRLCNDIGFTMVGLGGMLAAALSVAAISAQARAANLFGRRMTAFGYVVAVILLAAVLFVPIVALLVWLVVAAIVSLRTAPAQV